jgi:hypothetical protein
MILQHFSFEWLGINGLQFLLTAFHVIVDYNAGTPIVSIVASNTTDYRMSFVLGYVVNEGGILYINDVPHSSGRGVGRLSRMDFEISGRSRANAHGLIILSREKELQLLLLLLGTEVLEKLLIFSNATDNFDRLQKRIWRMERLLKLLYLKVSLIMDQVLLQQ